jgi:hypothetical protein
VQEAEVLKAHTSFDRCRHVEDAIFALGQRQLLDALFRRGLIVVDSRVKEHVRIPPSLLSSKLHTLKIIIVNLAHVVAAEALRLQLIIFVHFTLTDFTVIELVPLLEAIFISANELNQWRKREREH